jgi:hypothetical protein
MKDTAAATISRLYIHQAAGHVYISAVQGTTPTNDFEVITGTWYKARYETVISATVGTIKLWIDDVLKSNLTGLNTGVTNLGSVAMGDIGGGSKLDLYCDDASVYNPNDVLAANIYSAPLTISPNLVAFDDTIGTKKTTLAGLVADLNWFYAGRLYVYSTSSPTTRFTVVCPRYK